MKKFYTAYNNGVMAIVSEDVMADITQEQGICHTLTSENYRIPNRDMSKAVHAGLSHLGKPIFTFASNDRTERSLWFTGNRVLLSVLCDHIKATGGTIEESGFFVPFSNGLELGVHGDEAMAHELTFVTTEKQFIDTFGISRAELRAKVKLFKMDEVVRQANTQVFGDNRPVR